MVKRSATVTRSEHVETFHDPKRPHQHGDDGDAQKADGDAAVTLSIPARGDTDAIARDSVEEA